MLKWVNSWIKCHESVPIWYIFQLSSYLSFVTIKMIARMTNLDHFSASNQSSLVMTISNSHAILTPHVLSVNICAAFWASGWFTNHDARKGKLSLTWTGSLGFCFLFANKRKGLIQFSLAKDSLMGCGDRNASIANPSWVLEREVTGAWQNINIKYWTTFFVDFLYLLFFFKCFCLEKIKIFWARVSITYRFPPSNITLRNWQHISKAMMTTALKFKVLLIINSVTNTMFFVFIPSLKGVCSWNTASAAHKPGGKSQYAGSQSLEGNTES